MSKEIIKLMMNERTKLGLEILEAAGFWGFRVT